MRQPPDGPDLTCPPQSAEETGQLKVSRRPLTGEGGLVEECYGLAVLEIACLLEAAKAAKALLQDGMSRNKCHVR
jgi:hypothetical protein